jgi:hypothetical protein
METYPGALALAFKASTEVVHDDVRAATAEEDGVFATKTTASARHNNRLAIVPQFLRSHIVLCETMLNADLAM